MTVILRDERATTPAPIPAGRGRWRVSLHNRTFTSNANAVNTMITELPEARSRRLEQQLNTPAKFSFTIDGLSPAAALISELEQDVWLWRWDDLVGQDIPVFRGVLAQSEDILTEQSYVLNIVCLDYLAMLPRRYLTSPQTWTGVNQDTMVQYMMTQATSSAQSSSGTSFWPGSYLPLSIQFRNPDGSPRSQMVGVPTRDRVYAAQSSIGQLLDDLAHVINGFDYDAWPVSATSSVGADQMRIFFPQQGVTRSDVVLEYGGALSGVTRSVNSSDYANYVRTLGNNGSSDPAAPQLYGETWNDDANNIGTNPIGLWADAENAADVTDAATLVEKAQGTLNQMGVLVPSYSLTLTPGAFYRGFVNMGDTVPVVIQAGRLNVNTSIRVVGITYDVSDDGDETVALTVGRPLTDLVDMLAVGVADVDALARR